MRIHKKVLANPKYTSITVIPQPRVNTERNAAVAKVKGKPYANIL